MQQNNKRRGERGNVFFLILLGVVLFLALALTVSRGMRSDNTQRLSDQRATLAATDILTIARRIENGVNKVRRRGFSESDVDFTDDLTNVGSNTNCSEDSCRVFQASGGGVSLSPLGEDWLDSSFSASGSYNKHVIFYGFSIDGIGTANADLVFIVNFLKEEVCGKINDSLGITGIPLETNDPQSGQNALIGRFGNPQTNNVGDDNAALEGRSTFCVVKTNGNHQFIHVLIDR